MTPCRLFVDPPAAGAWNMAVDEALLDDAADRGLASLRFYQWSEPTLSLGYFQQYAERAQHAASAQATVVRRLSGGGALLHDRELTYALALPAEHPATNAPACLYATVHQALIDVLAERGIRARFHRADAPGCVQDGGDVSSGGDEPFLCFARRTSVDVILAAGDAAGDANVAGDVKIAGEVKIAGSAQRRRRGAVLQHGAVLLDASPAAPELRGISGVAPAALAAEDLVRPWSAALAQPLNVALQNWQRDEADFCQRCNDLAEKYADLRWTRRR